MNKKGTRSREAGKLSDQQTRSAVSFCYSSRGSGRAEKQGEDGRGRREKGEGRRGMPANLVGVDGPRAAVVGSGSEVGMVERRLGRAWRGRPRLRTRAESEVGRSEMESEAKRCDATPTSSATCRRCRYARRTQLEVEYNYAGTARHSMQSVPRRGCSIAV
jgi:hypothetical protein